VQQLRRLVTSSPLKAALFRACGPGRRGFSGAKWPHGGRILVLTGPAACGGGSSSLSGAAVRLLQAKASLSFPRYPPFLSSE